MSKLAVQAICPRVIGAANGLLEAAAGAARVLARAGSIDDQPGTAMSADVVEGTQGALMSANNKNALPGRKNVQIVSPRWDRFFPAYAEPFPAEYPLPLGFKMCLREVGRARQGRLHSPRRDCAIRVYQLMIPGHRELALPIVI